MDLVGNGGQEMKRILVLQDDEFSVHEMSDHIFDDISERADAMLKTGSSTSRGATRDMLRVADLQQTSDTIAIMIYDEVLDLRIK